MNQQLNELNNSTNSLIKRLLKGDKLALARLITEVENGNATKILRKLFQYSGKAYYIGITGPPGAGKSTLITKLALKLLDEKNKIGILAVDPTSPFSGGALLGDRVRMSELTTKKKVFIRSMASRGSLGGLAKKTKDVALLLDAFGMDYIIIETIGVGQVELDIADVCDTTVVTLVPESGDSIQVMKAGLLEIADIFVVNKADREGAERMAAELKFISELRNPKQEWEYPILTTIATEDKGIDELKAAIISHKEYLKKSGNFELRRKEKMRIRITELIEEKIMEYLNKKAFKKAKLDNLIDKVYAGKLNPFEIADKFVEEFIK